MIHATYFSGGGFLSCYIQKKPAKFDTLTSRETEQMNK